MRAAEYVRVSTDHQKYSILNQQSAIAEYAVQHGFEVVKTYADPAKSGLDIKHRPGLQRLLNDVLTGEADFKAVLVYDVSRWGRFQDTDEAAHYEFLCRSADVPVYYCAEHFADDVTVSAAVIKALKRSMASEYSRELSIKVHGGQKLTALHGFRAGGIPGYGLRRLAVSQDGMAGRMLALGEIKPFASDRVKLVPGPPEEVAIVRHIYDVFVRGRGKVGFSDIATELNRLGIRSSQGRLWTRFKVREVLRNPKYAGVLVWSKNTQKLRTKPRPNPKCEWIINKKAFEPLIDQRTFARAQALFKRRLDRKVPDLELIRSLKAILLKYGHLSEAMLSAGKGKFSAATYYRRLGTMQDIYNLLDVEYSAGLLAPFPRAPAILNVRNSIILRLVNQFPSELRAIRLGSVALRSSLLLDGKYAVYVWLAVHYRTKTGKVGWKLHPPKTEKGAPILLCMMDSENRSYESLYLFADLDLPWSDYKFAHTSDLLKTGRKLAGISDLCSQLRRLVEASRNRVAAEVSHDPALTA